MLTASVCAQSKPNVVLVMTDDGSENPPIPGEDTVTYNVGGLAPEKESVWAFLCREQIVTGKVVLKDYNYRTPDTALKSELDRRLAQSETETR